MTNSYNTTTPLHLAGWGNYKKLHHSLRLPSAGLFIVIMALFAFALSSNAQTVNFTWRNTRLTVPVNTAVFTVVSNNVPYTTNGLSADGLGNNVIQPISLNVTGLPSGVSLSLTNLGDSPPTPFTATLLRTNSNNTLHLGLNFTIANTTAEGTYPLTITASGGATNHFVFYLDVAHIWNGSSNAVADGAGLWSDSGKWQGGALPLSGANVVFTEYGGQTNNLQATAVSTNYLVNTLVDNDMTISSLRFAQTTNFALDGWHNLQIAPGKTLTINGPGGFSQVRDIMDETAGITDRSGVTVVGTNGATLVVNNTSANVYSLIDNTVSTIDMSALDTFSANVKVLGLGDPWIAQPNFYNFYSNNYAGLPRKFVPNFNFGRTNIVKANFLDAYNYTNALDREYAISIDSTLTGNSSQSTVPLINLGISNTFFADSILVGGAAQRPQFQFNPIFARSNSFALFRGTNGGRMTTFTEADAAGPGSTRGNVKAVVDLTRGTIDMLVDQFYIGRDRPVIESGQNPNYQGVFSMANGIIDANIAYLGYRQYPGGTNDWTLYSGYCEGGLNILSNGVFKVNSLLTLGSTAETNINGLGSGGNTEWGRITLDKGATLIANQINVGGPAYTSSANNWIGVTNGSLLNCSNTIAGPKQFLDSITFNNGNLTLTLNSTNVVAAVYATNFITVGSCTFTVAGIRNPGFLTNGTLIPLFKWTSGGAPNFSAFVNQSGINGAVVDDGVVLNQKDFQVILSTPKNLRWKGSVSASWDNTTTNWFDLNALVYTNFSTGDNVIFDDSAVTPSVNVTVAVLPGSITVTNLASSYIFNSSGGSIVGSSTLTKAGSGSLEIDCTSGLNIQLNQGTLTGAGSIGSANTATGTTMDFSGNISGSVTTAGTTTFEPTANMVGSLSVNSGVTTNFGTINSSFTVGVGGVLVNGLNGNFTTFGTSLVSSNAFLLNRGFLGVDLTHCGVNLTINPGGTFEDTGEGWVEMIGTLTIAPGATFIPGGDGVGTSSIFKGTGTGFPARVLLSQGSTNIFKVNNDNGTYTQLGSGYQDFGASASVRTFNGATIKIVNVGSAPITAGQSFPFFFNSDLGAGTPIAFTGTATNTWPVIDPLVPALGLGWDISAVTVKGVIKVVTVATNIPTIGFLPNVTTLITTNSTNSLILNGLTWPSDHTGWTLQQLQPPLSVGVLATNWQDVFGSMWTNSMVITNSVSSNTATFFRLKYP